MIDFIASKEANTQGQLEKLAIPSPMLLISPIAKSLPVEDIPHVVLIHNQFESTDEILDLAEHNLIFSSGEASKTICEKLYGKTETNMLEKNSINFLLNAIVYYNASYDYTRVLLRLLFSQYLQAEFSRNRVENEVTLSELELSDWFFALGSLITKGGSFFNWFENNRNIPDDIRSDFIVLSEKNKELKIKYRANQLKHGAIPHFIRSDPSNVIGSRMFVTLDNFYHGNNETLLGVSSGFPAHSMNIGEVQEFLIDYNNTTVVLVRKLWESFNSRYGLNLKEM